MSNTYAWAQLKGVRDGDDGQRRYTFLASSAALDRQGEVVTVDGWQLDNYRRNPVVIDSHDYRSIANIIGQTVELRQTDDGLEADVVWASTERGRLAAQLADDGALRAVSVGFRSIEHTPATATEPLRHTSKELLEISAVAVPANQEAVRLRGLDGLGDLETKAGRTLSRANEARLRNAVALLGEVLEQLGEPEAETDEARAVPPPTIDLTALSALVSFAKDINHGDD